MIGLARVFSCRKVHRYFFIRGSKSRNKVAVGEPAAGSFFRMKNHHHTHVSVLCRLDVEYTLHRCFDFGHGSHNVSRWMTWLPISLKNAAKCDKWYQLQNQPITESLNAKGAREKTLQGSSPCIPHSQCRIKNLSHEYFLYEWRRAKTKERVLVVGAKHALARVWPDPPR